MDSTMNILKFRKENDSNTNCVCDFAKSLYYLCRYLAPGRIIKVRSIICRLIVWSKTNKIRMLLELMQKLNNIVSKT